MTAAMPQILKRREISGQKSIHLADLYVKNAVANLLQSVEIPTLFFVAKAAPTDTKEMLSIKPNATKSI